MRYASSNANSPLHLTHVRVLAAGDRATAPGPSLAAPSPADLPGQLGTMTDASGVHGRRYPPAGRNATTAWALPNRVGTCRRRPGCDGGTAGGGGAGRGRRLAIRSVSMQVGDGGAVSRGRRVRRRDRRGRGLRGGLVPTEVPLYRSRAEQFEDLVLDAVARLEPRWESQLARVEFAVEEVPDDDTLRDADATVPLARTVRATGSGGPPGRHPPGGTPRIVLYRRPLVARADGEDELSDLVFDVVVEEFAALLGLDPEAVDPGYGGPK